MAELPKGVIKEVRRGGSGVLELLLIDFDRESGDGYIRIEKTSTPNAIAQLVIIGGKPAMALFEKESLLIERLISPSLIMTMSLFICLC